MSDDCTSSDTSSEDLEFELLSLSAEGNLSLGRLRKLCSSIAKCCDGVPQHVREIGKLSQIQPSHTERDLHRWAKRQHWRHLLPEPYTFKLPVTHDGGITETYTKHDVLLPHEFVSSLSTMPKMFRRLLYGSRANLENFWMQSDGAWRQSHPVWEVNNDPCRAIPIGIFGDDSGVFTSDKFLVLFWGSVALTHLLSVDSRLLFGAVQYKIAIANRTVEELYKVLTWSLQWLAIGEHPDRDHNGCFFFCSTSSGSAS